MLNFPTSVSVFKRKSELSERTTSVMNCLRNRRVLIISTEFLLSK